MSLEPKGTVQFFTAAAARQHLFDWLFIETLADLAERADAPKTVDSRYRVLGIAPLLRKLMVDGGKNLLDLVRHPAGRPLPVFRASAYPAQEIPEGTVTVGTAVHYMLNRSAAPVGRDEFLRMNAGHAAGRDLTVREIIRHYANVEGGVHLGKPEILEADLLQLAGPRSPIFQPMPFLVLAQIAHVVVDACGPLLRAVESDYARRDTRPEPSELENPAARLGLQRPEPPA
jgi:hypothetical protein